MFYSRKATIWQEETHCTRMLHVTFKGMLICYTKLCCTTAFPAIFLRKRICLTAFCHARLYCSINFRTKVSWGPCCDNPLHAFQSLIWWSKWNLVKPPHSTINCQLLKTQKFSCDVLPLTDATEHYMYRNIFQQYTMLRITESTEAIMLHVKAYTRRLWVWRSIVQLSSNLTTLSLQVLYLNSYQSVCSGLRFWRVVIFPTIPTSPIQCFNTYACFCRAKWPHVGGAFIHITIILPSFTVQQC